MSCEVVLGLYIAPPLEVSVGNQVTNTNSVDTAGGAARNVTVCLFVCFYHFGWRKCACNHQHSLTVLVFLCRCLLISVVAVQFFPVHLVYVSSDQALLPPNHEPLGGSGHINQLWPRSAPLIGIEVCLLGRLSSSVVVHVCLFACCHFSTCIIAVTAWGKAWLIYQQTWGSFKSLL